MASECLSDHHIHWQAKNLTHDVRIKLASLLSFAFLPPESPRVMKYIMTLSSQIVYCKMTSYQAILYVTW